MQTVTDYTDTLKPQCFDSIVVQENSNKMETVPKLDSEASLNPEPDSSKTQVREEQTIKKPEFS